MIGVVAAVVILAVVAGQAAVMSRVRAKRQGARPATVVASGSEAGTAVTVAADRPRDPVSRLVDLLRRRRWVRRSLSLASVAIMLVAVGMIGYPFYTNLVQSRIQSRLDRQLASPELRQAYLEGRIQPGDSLTRIIIPDLDIDVVVVEGTDSNSLRAGAGHYVSTPLPCEPGNVSIAGHRTTYGRPFHNLDLLDVGDEITLETPVGSCTYELSERPFITTPENVGVIANTPDARLTLTTCHPKGSARERLIVVASLVSSQPATDA